MYACIEWRQLLIARGIFSIFLVLWYFGIFGLQPCRNIDQLRLKMVTEEALKALSRIAGRSH